MGSFISELLGWVWQIATSIAAWLDRHEGTLMVLLTAALVWIAYKSAKIALANLELMKQNDDKRSRPYVTIEVVNDMPFYGVRMVNLGSTAAHYITVKSEPKIEMVFQNYKKQIKFLNEPVAYLAPSARLETDIGSFRDIERENPTKIYNGIISFQDDVGNVYHHDFVLDFSSFTDAVHKDEKTIHHVAQQLEEIKRELANIGTGFHKPHILTEDCQQYNERVRAALEEEKQEVNVFKMETPTVENKNGGAK